MTDFAHAFAERLKEAMTDHEVFEAAQLGDVMWMQSSLAEIDVGAELRARWTLRFERLYEKVQMRLGELAKACGEASASPSDETLAAVDRALATQGALWDEIEEAETILAQDVPEILDSDWRPFPPHLKAARAARNAARSEGGP